jgi:hypothetical protein
MSPFPCNHLNQIWYDFFSSTLPNEHILDLNKTCFSCTTSLKSNCMIFYIPFDYSKTEV